MLLRHTKSSWSDPGMGDHERTLNARGRRGANIMASHIAHHCPRPDAIICSSAVRTQETLAPIVTALGDDAPEPFVTQTIYEAPASAYHGVIAGAGDGQSILVVGHNPTTEVLAMRLCGQDERLMEHIATGYPTGGLTVLEFADAAWADALHAGGRFVSFTAPRLLENASPPLASAD